VVTAGEVIAMQDEVSSVKVDDDLLEYIARIVDATRRTELIELGVSPRGSLTLRACAQAKAYLEGRDYCVPDDIKQLVIPVLAHRIQVAKTFETSGFTHHEDQAVLMQVIEGVEVPV
jgi:MoxR-like ATPase